MAFPTIPTAGNGRLLTGQQADTSQTRTFPSLTGLTKNSGDLLIAICIAYQTTGSPAFSSWSASPFFNSVSLSTSSTMAIGVAWGWSDGTETGTFTVTQATTITGHASMILLSIAGAHASESPVWTTKVDDTAAAANPGSLSPGWTGDTLWIAIAGSGELNTTGSYTGIASAPANYSSYAETGMTGDVAGAVEGAVAFRQLNAASEDVGTFSVDLSNARNSAVVFAVRPVPPTPLPVPDLNRRNLYRQAVSRGALR